jgi:hypothetical protein
MLNYVLRTILAGAVFATALALSGRADAMMVSNPASVVVAVAATILAPEQVRVSCNLRIPCPLPNITYGRAHSRTSGRYYYEACRCDFGSARECAPIISCYAEGGRCRGSCPSQSGLYPYPPAN